MLQSRDVARIRKLPPLPDIFAIPTEKERFHALQDFLFCKSIKMELPLTDAEQKFRDTRWMFTAIVGDGWPSVFEDSFDYGRIAGIVEVLRFCGQDLTADSVEEARELFYNGRTDLTTLQARHDAGIRGFRHPSERRRFYALGEVVEQLPYSEHYWELLRWPEAHRSEFVDFPRP
ncbi:MAG: hypothetical protein EOP84_23840 [Verrucomicrobiaceae bacterium]|nr:MAG: hypothetical protein EOP84_23840 [Verrucomicrobiaceae bacterium]